MRKPEIPYRKRVSLGCGDRIWTCDLRVMRMRKFIFPVHLFAKAASGAGITFSSGNEWYGLHLEATSVTVPVNGTKVVVAQHKHKSTNMWFAMTYWDSGTQVAQVCRSYFYNFTRCCREVAALSWASQHPVLLLSNLMPLISTSCFYINLIYSLKMASYTQHLATVVMSLHPDYLWPL